MDKEKLEMVPVPLPTEIPTPPSLDQLPFEVLHSATVEMLIQQNEDLTSRLKVNIRSNSQLEQKILELEGRMKRAEQIRDNLTAQNQIILEKEKLWSDQKQSTTRQLATLEEEIQLLEVRYAELGSTSKATLKEQKELVISTSSENEKLKKRLKIFTRVRERAKERLREFIINTATEIARLNKSLRQSEAEKKLLIRDVANLNDRFRQQGDSFGQQVAQLKDKTEQSLNRLQEKKISADDQIDSLNKQIQEMSLQYNELQAELREEKKNRHRVSQLSQELDEANNERIQLQRKAGDDKNRLLEQHDGDKARIKQLEKQLKNTQVQFEEQKEILATCEGKILELSKDNKEMAAQLESLQSLWIDGQSRLEKAELKAKSLEKINRELSQSRKQERQTKAIKAAHPEVDSEKERLSDKLTEVYASQFTTIHRAPEMDV